MTGLQSVESAPLFAQSNSSFNGVFALDTLPNSTAARDVAYYLHPATNARRHESVGPMVIERGEGIYVFDDQGKEYIEGLAGLWSVAVGFGEERLVQAAATQMRKLPFYHSFSHKSHEPAVALAFCAGNFPQLVRNLHLILQKPNLAELRPQLDQIIGFPLPHS